MKPKKLVWLFPGERGYSRARRLKLAFCATGEGGGKDPTCGKGGGAKSEVSKNISKLIAKLAKDGGFTYNPKDSSVPTTGFVVSPYKQAEKVLTGEKIATVADFHEYMGANSTLLGGEGAHFGGWFNPDDGNVYLDVSVVVQDKTAAMKLATDNKQLAIFDLDTKETINAM